MPNVLNKNIQAIQIIQDLFLIRLGIESVKIKLQHIVGHGLFCRGGHAPYFVEVLDRDEETRVRPLHNGKEGAR